MIFNSVKTKFYVNKPSYGRKMLELVIPTNTTFKKSQQEISTTGEEGVCAVGKTDS